MYMLKGYIFLSEQIANKRRGKKIHILVNQ